MQMPPSLPTLTVIKREPEDIYMERAPSKTKDLFPGRPSFQSLCSPAPGDQCLQADNDQQANHMAKAGAGRNFT